MKNILTLIVLLGSLSLLNAQNLLNQPESIVYDEAFGRYLVSNHGDGKIIQIDEAGVQSDFNTDLSSTLGLHIVGDMLYVSTNDGPYAGIAGIPLSTGIVGFHVNIPEKELLNDITSDLDGNLYVTDCDANKIFKVSIPDTSYTTLISSGLGYPNGILYDISSNSLLVLNGLLAGRPILSVNLDDLSISTLVETGISAIDGLTEDNQGNYYFSSWTTDCVYRYDHLFTDPPENIAGGFTNPADIFYNKTNNILAIPNFSADTIIFLPISPVILEEPMPDDEGSLFVYPNPFSDRFVVRFSQNYSITAEVKIYDINGKLISKPENIEMSRGEFTLLQDGSRIKPGVYILSVYDGETRQSCKIFKQ